MNDIRKRLEEKDKQIDRLKEAVRELMGKYASATGYCLHPSHLAKYQELLSSSKDNANV